MEIQWFAGHMARTKRIIKEKLKLIDVVLELVDARIPLSSRSPLITGILKAKPGLLILNKADLADPVLTGRWVKWFHTQGVTAIPFDAARGRSVEEVLREISRLVPRKKESRETGKLSELNRNIPPSALRPPAFHLRPPTSLVVGIPNVGKSMFINCLAGRRAARTGQLPGLTRGEQWIRIAGKMELLDTPGVLWPKLEDQEVAMKLAATGAIKEEFFDAGQVAAWVLQWLVENKKSELLEHFGLGEKFSETEEIEAILEIIGRKRGFLASGGVVDRYKTSVHVLKEFRSGRLGRYTLELPPAEDEAQEAVLPKDL